MASAADERKDSPIKLCLTGDSGVGKSGAIVPLILAGYKVRAIDVDNGEDIVLDCLRNPDSPYFALASKLDLADVFRYETVNHKMITLDLGKDEVRIQPSAAIVWPRIEKLLHEWKEDSGVKLGSITSWGPDTVLVIDSSTFAGYAAFAYVQQINNHLGQTSGNSWRRDIGGAQEHLESMLRLLYSSAVKCHVIVITHINYLNESWQESEGGTRTRVVSSSADGIFGSDRAYPSSIGRALGPKFGRYFNNVVEMRIEGTGANVRRVIHTTPQGAVNVKTSSPFSLRRTYDVSTGLAEIFATLRHQEQPKALLQALAKPKLVPTIGASATVPPRTFKPLAKPEPTQAPAPATVLGSELENLGANQ